MNTPRLPAWQPPLPFLQFVPPPFPTDALPDWLKQWVEAEAIDTQTSPDVAAVLGLAVVATATAKKFKVVIKAGWDQPVNGYFVVALPPGERKSPVFKAAVAPLELYMRDEALRLAPEIRRAMTLKNIATKRLKRAVEKAAKTSDEKAADLEGEAEALTEALDQIEVPLVPRLIVDDVTPEKLAMLMAEHGGRMAVMSEEGGIFDLMAGRYSRDGSPNFEVFLKGWDGGDLRVDRVSRPPEHILEPALTIGLTFQPAVLWGLNAKQGFSGRGLLARFFYSLPISRVGSREHNPPPMPESVRVDYQRKVLALLQLTADIDQHGNPRPHDLLFSQAARARFDEYRAELEPRLGPLGDLELHAEWGAKLAGGIARIAGLLHLARYAEERPPWELPIDPQTIEAAILIGNYYVPHAKAAFAEMNADPEVEQAKVILKWIERKRITRFSKRDAFNALRARFGKVDRMAVPLALLVSHNYIQPIPQESPPREGRPTEAYEVNPLNPPQYSQNTQNPQAKEGFADIAGFAEATPDEIEPPRDDATADDDLEEGAL